MWIWRHQKISSQRCHRRERVSLKPFHSVARSFSSPSIKWPLRRCGVLTGRDHRSQTPSPSILGGDTQNPSVALVNPFIFLPCASWTLKLYWLCKGDGVERGIKTTLERWHTISVLSFKIHSSVFELEISERDICPIFWFGDNQFICTTGIKHSGIERFCTPQQPFRCISLSARPRVWSIHRF